MHTPEQALTISRSAGERARISVCVRESERGGKRRSHRTKARAHNLNRRNETKMARCRQSDLRLAPPPNESIGVKCGFAISNVQTLNIFAAMSNVAAHISYFGLLGDPRRLRSTQRKSARVRVFVHNAQSMTGCVCVGKQSLYLVARSCSPIQPLRQMASFCAALHFHSFASLL